MRAVLTVLASLLLITDLAAADPGDPRAIRGTLEWPVTLTAEPMAVVRGDDGRFYYVDASTAERLAAPITGRVSIVGVEGTKAQEVAAIVIGSGDAALAAVQAPRAEPGGEVAASPRTTDDLWQVQGRVRAVTVGDILLETPQGQAVRIDASKLSPWTRQTLRAGDQVKLFGIPQADQRLVANGFIQMMPSVPSASPSSR
jgi:hypothetical protein